MFIAMLWHKVQDYAGTLAALPYVSSRGQPYSKLGPEQMEARLLLFDQNFVFIIIQLSMFLNTRQLPVQTVLCW